MKQEESDQFRFVEGFRDSAPYIHAFRGRTMVVVFGGEHIGEQRFTALAHDIALLNSLGIRLVLVHGLRPQIEQRLRARGVELQYRAGVRITDAAALACVKEAAGSTRVEIESLLSMGLPNTPMAGARIRVASGNYVTARPVGVLDGVDHLYTGQVRRIDHDAIRRQLDDGAIVLLSPIGYSPTGEVFNLTAREVATAAAAALRADKYIHLAGLPGLPGGGGPARTLALSEAQELIESVPDDTADALKHGVAACRAGVRRAHLVPGDVDGALLVELFTRDGVGTMITADVYEGTREATIEDVGGILGLIAPLEEEGVLVRRSREHLEIEIDQFTVVERDGAIIACAALHPFPDARVGELACLAVDDGCRHGGYGESLLRRIESRARNQGIERLFVLTTHAPHWFLERGFQAAALDDLPVERRQMYNYKRNAKVLIKPL